ncbi:MAG: peptide chain release factor N(5)-glutamine methyltransferase [Lachnospiraceae bacterium]|nr:peptide chain release factor N(5)-glutamine methyltransferase [Lachnospiraceae bacterium]MBQ5485414.1 peptide chain release factor N(5)-glutamine methyltransferase [Lachnospiraceae bacterium]
MTYQELEKEGSDLLTFAGVMDPRVDARQLLLFVSKKSAASLLLDQRETVPLEVEGEYRNLLEKRQKRVPLQHIIGETEFMGLTFQVSSDVLCPRQDTEILVEEVLRLLKDGDGILDLCTGSGCIGISLMVLGSRRIGGLKLDGADLSEKALAVARRNAWRNGLREGEADYYNGDLFDAIPAGRKYNVIVSNPPYIPSRYIEQLMPEVRDHEPLMALDGMEDGLFFYRKITQQAPFYLKEGGLLCYEIGYDQGESVPKLLQQAGFMDVRVIKDLSGNDRVVIGHL